MNVIIEPLSEQAWARVETRVMERLASDPANASRAPRARPLWACQLARALRSVRRRLSSWLEPRADEALGIDSAPESCVRRRAEPLSEPWVLSSQ
jgi:hypothetical protein